MSHALSIRALRQALLAQSTSSSVDEVEIEALRQDIARTVQEIRQSMNRVLDFASRGLVSEAAALVDDFPDLAGEALGLTRLPASIRPSPGSGTGASIRPVRSRGSWMRCPASPRSTRSRCRPPGWPT